MVRIIGSVCLAVVVLGAGLAASWALHEQGEDYLLLTVSMVMSIMLTALPLFVCHVQTISLQRQIAKLDTLNDRSVSNTAHFKVAHNTLTSINPAILDKHYTLPMLTFAFVIIFCWLMTNAAYFKPHYFERFNVVLGGLHVLGSSSADTDIYQRGTFVAGCFGFIGAYIYTNWRLLDRINNNDIYPISFYYYSARMLAVCFIAGAFRHVIPESVGNIPVILVSFAVGFIPDVLITSIIRRASQVVKVLSDQPDPKPDVLPTNFSLLMIQGVDRDKIDRLSELYVTNAEVLACQNPFILWLRLPYELLLLIDWISQAQLYRIMKEDKFTKLRAIGICGSLDFVLIASSPEACEAVAQTIGLSTKVVDALAAGLRVDPTFLRLEEVQSALRQPF